MKEDRFEKYIRNFRQDLDVDEPDMEIIWEGVQQELSHQRSKRWLWTVAATVALLIGAGLFLFSGQENSKLSYPNVVAQLAPSLAAEEEKFLLMIAEKEELLSLDQLDRGSYREIFSELDLLEKIRKESYSDIDEFGQKDQLIKALMKYYERKLRLLEILSNEIEKREYNEKRNSEKRI